MTVTGAGSSTATVGVVGCGVTGAQVVGFLAGLPGVTVAMFDAEPGVARRLASSVGGVAVRRLDDLHGTDVVALCHPAPHVATAAVLVRGKVPTVSMSDDPEDVRALLALDVLAGVQGTALVVGAAKAPGLSGLIARYLAAQLHVVEELHVAIHGTGGPACAKRHHRALGDKAAGWHDGQWIERTGGSGRELCWFPEPMGAHDCYRAAHADPLLFHLSFPEVARISARVSASRRDRLTPRLPMLTPPHSGGNVGAVRVEARGSLEGGARATVIAGAAGRCAQLAAAVCASAVEAVLEGRVPAGTSCPGSTSLEPADLLYRATRFGVRVEEYTGIAHPMTW